MTVAIDQIKSLREKTGAGVMECRSVIEQAMELQKSQKVTDEVVKCALEMLKQKGLEVAVKKQDRDTRQGIIETYSHCGGKVVAVVELLCETDFVARNEEFKNMAHELAMQVAAMDPKSANELLEQEYIRDATKKVSDLLNEVIGKIRENIKVGRIARFELGE